MIIHKPEILRLRGSHYFAGATNQQVRYPNVGFNLSPPQGFTICTWMYPEGAITGNPYISTNYSVGSDSFDIGWRLYSWASQDRVLAFNEAAYRSSSTTITWDAWQHWAYTDTGDPTSVSNFTLFKNGVSAGSAGTGFGSAYVNTAPFDYVIGNRPQEEGIDGAEFEGLMAHHAVWRRVLRDDELLLLGTGHSPLWFMNGLVFYSPMNDRAVTDIIGAKINRHNGWTQRRNTKTDIEIYQPPWVKMPQRFFNFPVGISEATLVIRNLSQSNSVDKVSTTKESTLAIENLSQDNAVDTIVLVQASVLSSRDLSQTNIVDKPLLETEGTIAGYALAQTNTVSVPSLTQTHVLNTYDISQSNFIEKPWVNTAYQLSVINISQANTFSVPTFTQVHNLTGLGLSQSNYVQLVYLGEWWYELHEDIGLVTTTYSVVGYVELLHEEYALIDQEHDLSAYIDQQLDGDGEIAQEHGQDALIAVTYEQDGEI